MARVVIDPVTRIEGHLRIETEVNGGRVTDAWSSGTMFRGIELILRGRDPREAKKVFGSVRTRRQGGNFLPKERAFRGRSGTYGK